MKHYHYPFICLLLVACANNKVTRQASVPALVDAVQRPSFDTVYRQDAVETKADRVPVDSEIGEPVEMRATQLKSWLRQQQWDTRYEKKLAFKLTEKSIPDETGEYITTAVLANDAYQIINVTHQSPSFDHPGIITINGDRIRHYLGINGDTTDAALSIGDVYTFKSSQHRYLLFTCSSLRATGTMEQVTLGLLVNMDSKPYTARMMYTYMEPGRFYVCPSVASGRMKYLSVIPLDNDNGAIAENIAVHIKELREP